MAVALTGRFFSLRRTEFIPFKTLQYLPCSVRFDHHTTIAISFFTALYDPRIALRSCRAFHKRVLTSHGQSQRHSASGSPSAVTESTDRSRPERKRAACAASRCSSLSSDTDSTAAPPASNAQAAAAAPRFGLAVKHARHHLCTSKTRHIWPTPGLFLSVRGETVSSSDADSTAAPPASARMPPRLRRALALRLNTRGITCVRARRLVLSYSRFNVSFYSAAP